MIINFTLFDCCILVIIDFHILFRLTVSTQFCVFVKPVAAFYNNAL